MQDLYIHFANRQSIWKLLCEELHLLFLQKINWVLYLYANLLKGFNYVIRKLAYSASGKMQFYIFLLFIIFLKIFLP